MMFIIDLHHLGLNKLSASAKSTINAAVKARCCHGEAAPSQGTAKSLDSSEPNDHNESLAVFLMFS